MVDVHLISSIRMAVLIGWAIISLMGLGSWRRGLCGKPLEGDWIQASLSVVGVALVGFQANVLSGAVPPRSDYWSAVLLFLLAVAAGVVLLLVHLPKTPVEHRRAVLWSHLAVLLLCVAGGVVE